MSTWNRIMLNHLCMSYELSVSSVNYVWILIYFNARFRKKMWLSWMWQRVNHLYHSSHLICGGLWILYETCLHLKEIWMIHVSSIKLVWIFTFFDICVHTIHCDMFFWHFLLNLCSYHYEPVTFVCDTCTKLLRNWLEKNSLIEIYLDVWKNVKKNQTYMESLQPLKVGDVIQALGACNSSMILRQKAPYIFGSCAKYERWAR